jgi:cytoskeletal protein RodZ
LYLAQGSRQESRELAGFLAFRRESGGLALQQQRHSKRWSKHSLDRLGALGYAGENLPEKPKFTDDLDRERKKQKVLSLVLVAIVAVVVILFVLSLLRGHL